MSNPKNTLVQLDLSGNSIKFSEPVNYSKDFPRPSGNKFLFNIYDKDTYTNSAYTRVIRQSYWDYKKGFILTKVKGTLSMTVVIYHTNQKELDLTKNHDFLTALKLDFENDNTSQDIEDYGIDVPQDYTLHEVNGLKLGFYEYSIDDGRHIRYAFPLSDQHYLMLNYNFINNSRSEDTDWMKDAQQTVDYIISTFVHKK